MRKLSEEECRAFLREGARTGKVAVVRADGAPMVVPVWFLLDDEALWFTTWHTTVKARAIRRERRVSICVDDDTPPFAYVRLDGVAELLDDHDQLVRVATAVGGRYMGADRAEEFGRRNAVAGELVVRVRPTRIVGVAELTGSPA